MQILTYNGFVNENIAYKSVNRVVQKKLKYKYFSNRKLKQIPLQQGVIKKTLNFSTVVIL